MKKLFTSLFVSLFLLSCTSEIKYPEHFPDFSWDKVSTYVQLASANDFTDQEYELISKFDIVCLEKSHGTHKFKGYDNALSVTANRLKELNPKVKVIGYVSFNTDYSGFYSGGSVLKKNPEWALRYDNGKYATTNGKVRHIDRGVVEAREYYKGLLKDFSSKPGIDGLFIDSYHKVFKSTVAERLEGTQLMREFIRDSIANNKIVIGNSLGVTNRESDVAGLDYIHTVSGGMLDHFAFRSGDKPNHIATCIERVSNLGKQGKIVVMKCWPDVNHKTKGYYRDYTREQKEQSALKDITFPLACYLCAAEKYTYFCYSASWKTIDCAVRYPEMDNRLGEPKGDFERNGYEFTREFKYASVWVDVKTKRARINWK